MNTPGPARYQCRRIHVDGRRCGSPCLRGEEFCYFHHTTRTPAKLKELAERERLRETFELPLPEDRSAIQHGIGQVLQRIASNSIDPRRAGLLLYGLQIAALNLPKPTATPLESVEEIVHDEAYGPLAPIQELLAPEKEESFFDVAMDHWNQQCAAEAAAQAAQPITLQAVATTNYRLPTTNYQLHYR